MNQIDEIGTAKVYTADDPGHALTFLEAIDQVPADLWCDGTVVAVWDQATDRHLLAIENLWAAQPTTEDWARQALVVAAATGDPGDLQIWAASVCAQTDVDHVNAAFAQCSQWSWVWLSGPTWFAVGDPGHSAIYDRYHAAVEQRLDHNRRTTETIRTVLSATGIPELIAISNHTFGDAAPFPDVLYRYTRSQWTTVIPDDVRRREDLYVVDSSLAAIYLGFDPESVPMAILTGQIPSFDLPAQQLWWRSTLPK